jgi:hypothetical protein
MTLRLAAIALLSMICATSGHAQQAVDAVTGVHTRLERAEQTGDFKAWMQLWDAATRAQAGDREMQGRPQPDLHYNATRTLVQDDQAATIAQISDGRNVTIRFTRENGEWKIAGQMWSDQPPEPLSIYAVVPPPDGAFARAGSPWADVVGSKLSAAYDDDYVYLRLASSTALPAPESEAISGTVPPTWPHLKLRVTEKAVREVSREFSIDVGANIGDRATFDERGKAKTHFHYLSYGLMVFRADHLIFNTSVEGRPNRLISVGPNAIEVRIPMKSIGVSGSLKMEIIDPNLPTRSPPYEVRRFPR